MNGINSIGSSGGNGVFSTGGASFGENPFLQVLVQQLRSQTPLEPLDNGTFMQQMSAFSSMEEQRQLNDNLLQLLEFQGVLARMQGLSEGSSLLGKEITYDPGNGTEVKGIAESVFVDPDGQVYIVVDGEEITPQQILGVAEGV